MDDILKTSDKISKLLCLIANLKNKNMILAEEAKEMKSKL